jgi:hypothetical protein
VWTCGGKSKGPALAEQRVYLLGRLQQQLDLNGRREEGLALIPRALAFSIASGVQLRRNAGRLQPLQLHAVLVNRMGVSKWHEELVRRAWAQRCTTSLQVFWRLPMQAATWADKEAMCTISSAASSSCRYPELSRLTHRR